ncbi:MAG: hemin uptake protein HemP [Mizugakiibacter sp.]|uniref:hemin uptake protein HemP n=1 Tax=Mizugakiibacter sp. TaxID=1972610 RepID=UPI0031C65471|nr:hemin uptake protein HemP [Xanthomonadaceae bacterium]
MQSLPAPPSTASQAARTRPSSAPSRQSTTAPRIESRHLLHGARELVIEHLGGEYRLRLTRNDKLILTK